MVRNLVLGVLVATAAFGCATSSTQKSAADSRAANLKSAAATDTHCVADTASRIKRTADKPCGATPGTTYTQQDLETTGRLNTAEALKQLDPRIQ
jgi:hypothetical protein